ncbi:MAG: hypothetical protein K6E40_17540, partial [Desulfovibrio sp.]|nr:hypothetical protein [Desulfovibrio sp.]
MRIRRRGIWLPDFPQKEFDALFGFVKKALDKAATNSGTIGVPPSQDPSRERKSRSKGQRKPGVQPGHLGTTLEMVDELVVRSRNLKINLESDRVSSQGRTPYGKKTGKVIAFRRRA